MEEYDIDLTVGTEAPVEAEPLYTISDFYNINILDVGNNGQLIDIENIDIVKKGRYIGTSTWGDVAEFGSCKLNVQELDKSKLSSAKIYRFPNLSLPREKVNIINDKYGSRVIRDRNKADIAIISEKYLSSIKNMTYNSPNYPSKDAVSNLLLCNSAMYPEMNEVFTSEAIDTILSFLEKVNNNDKFCVTKPYYYSHAQTSKIKNKVDIWLHSLDKQSHGYTHYIDEENVESFEWLFNNEHKLCWDSEINNFSSEDSVPLTEETHNNVAKMLSSGDSHDRVLALEIMANCNADSSYTYLAMLFFFHAEAMKNTKNWNHVNFKALRNRFENYITYPNFHTAYPYDLLIRRLVEADSLTEYAVQVITKRMFDSVLNSTFGIKSDSVFNIDPSTLMLKEEFKKKITKKDVKQDDLPF